jgi:hypothetical protein
LAKPNGKNEGDLEQQTGEMGWIHTEVSRKIRGEKKREGQKEEKVLPKDEELCLINEMQVLIENGWKHL